MTSKALPMLKMASLSSSLDTYTPAWIFCGVTCSGTIVGEAKTTSTPTSSTTQAQVTYVSESVSYSKSEAKSFKVNEEFRNVRWWEIVLRRPTAATKDHMISSYDDRHGPPDACTTSPQPLKMEILLEPTSNKLMVGDLCDSIQIKLVTTGKKRWCDSIRIKLVPGYLKMVVKVPDSSWLTRFITTCSYPTDKHKDISIKVKEFQRSFRHSDTERLSRSDEVLKLKNFKKDATLKLSKSTNQEWYEHVGPEVTRSQDDKVTRWRNEIMLG
ncbi:hypothetical protein Tco_0838395 [Tanacetum coccineum]|uniref:Uncharacterized protein n=1 Tax=Tanacetum coccineum TaxID=301880 RepID=A0ABQ5ARX7_9ASTR